MKNKHWIALFALSAILCLTIGLLLGRGKAAKTASIYQNGALLQTVPLDHDAHFTISAPNGGSNTVVVSDGRVRVEQATCPDKVCVNQGWSSSKSKPIVCLPNGLVIQPEGGEVDFDAVTN